MQIIFHLQPAGILAIVHKTCRTWQLLEWQCEWEKSLSASLNQL